MVAVEDFRKYALTFPDVIESPHFEKTSFRVNKKIFATMDTLNRTVVMKLSEIDQSFFVYTMYQLFTRLKANGVSMAGRVLS